MPTLITLLSEMPKPFKRQYTDALDKHITGMSENISTILLLNSGDTVLPTLFRSQFIKMERMLR